MNLRGEYISPGYRQSALYLPGLLGQANDFTFIVNLSHPELAWVRHLFKSDECIRFIGIEAVNQFPNSAFNEVIAQ